MNYDELNKVADGIVGKYEDIFDLKGKLRKELLELKEFVDNKFPFRGSMMAVHDEYKLTSMKDKTAKTIETMISIQFNNETQKYKVEVDCVDGELKCWKLQRQYEWSHSTTYSVVGDKDKFDTSIVKSVAREYSELKLVKDSRVLTHKRKNWFEYFAVILRKLI